MADTVSLITGASSGIGEALAQVFAARGHRVALVARRADRLRALAETLTRAGAPEPLVIPCDLGAADAIDTIAGTMAEAAVEPDHIINNAGYGLLGVAADLPLDDQLTMIDVNVRALTALSLRFVPMLARHRGGILNVASTAAFVPGPNMAVYYASKAYVLSFSRALHEELSPRGVRVTALCPGPVDTGFAARAGWRRDTLGDLPRTTAQAVAEAGYDGLKAGKAVVIPGMLNKLMPLVARLSPASLAARAVQRMQQARRET